MPRRTACRPASGRPVQSPVINGIAGPIQQNSRCLTAEAVADLDKTFSPVSRTTNSTCEQVEHEISPQRLKWRLQCRGQIDMDVAGEVTLHNPRHHFAFLPSRPILLGGPAPELAPALQRPAPGGGPSR